MIPVGEAFVEFELEAHDGTTVSSSDLEGRPYLLFFYPKAFTAGCTAESCYFRDLAAEFAAVGAQRIGISSDDVATQADFAAHHDLGFPLLSDPDRSIAKRYGVKRPGLPLTKRMTFVIGADGRIIEVIASEFNMTEHADAALAALGS